MSVFSECLQNIKDVRGLRYADIAKSCEMDVTVIFRWMNGERLPENIKRIEKIERKLRLTEQEKVELEDAYLIAVYGEEKYRDFREVEKIVSDLGKIGLRKNKTEKISMPDDFKLDSDKHVRKEFKELHGREEMIAGIGEAMAILEKMNEKRICLVTQVMSTELETILSLYTKNIEGCRIEQIIYPRKNGPGNYHGKSMEVLEKIMNVAFQENDMQVWIGPESEDTNGLNQILSKYFFIQYNNDMTEGMMTTYTEWIEMAMHTFHYLKDKSILMGKKEIDGLQYAEANYRKDSIVRVIEYEPCVGACLDEETLRNHIYEDLPMREEMIQELLASYIWDHGQNINDIKIFFTDAGLREFMETGILDVFPYPVYTPLTIEERCEIIRRCVILSREGKKIHYLIRDSKLSELRNVHIEYIRDQQESIVRIDVNPKEGEKERMTLKHDSILFEFDNFFTCVNNEKFVYSKEETEEYMLKVVEEYKYKDTCLT